MLALPAGRGEETEGENSFLLPPPCDREKRGRRRRRELRSSTASSAPGVRQGGRRTIVGLPDPGREGERISVRRSARWRRRRRRRKAWLDYVDKCVRA